MPENANKKGVVLELFQPNETNVFKTDKERIGSHQQQYYKSYREYVKTSVQLSNERANMQNAQQRKKYKMLWKNHKNVLTTFSTGT